MIRSIRVWGAAATAACVALSAAVPSLAEFNAEADLSIEAATAYVWRGQVLTDRGVLFPATRVSTSPGLWLDAWGALDLSGENGSEFRGQFEKVDGTIGYAVPLGEASPVSLDVGLVQYLFPVAGGATRELFLTLGAALPITASLTAQPHGAVYWDVDELGGDGVYGLTGLDLSLACTETLALSAGASIGFANGPYDRFYFGPEDPAPESDEAERAALARLRADLGAVRLNDLRLDLRLDYQVSDAISVGLRGGYVLLPDDTVSEAAKLVFDDDRLLHGGIWVTAHLD